MKLAFNWATGCQELYDNEDNLLCEYDGRQFFWSPKLPNAPKSV